MKVRLLTTIVGGHGVWHEDEIVDVESAYGQRLVSSGQAEMPIVSNLQPPPGQSKPVKKRG